MNVAVRKKAARARRKSKSNVFHFCDLMCKGLEIKGDQRGEAPIPIFLKDEKDEFVLMLWNFWLCFISALKKELPKFLTKKEIRSTRGEMLFSLFCKICKNESDSYLFLVHQERVAQKLSISQRTHFFAPSPTDAFNKLRLLCFADDKEKEKLDKTQDLLKISDAIKKLSLPERCQLNLLLASARQP